jgi:hypothetical protein
VGPSQIGTRGCLEHYVSRLLETALVYLNDAHTLRYLTDYCNIAFLPDERIVGGENKTGRLDRWVRREAQTVTEQSVDGPIGAQ